MLLSIQQKTGREVGKCYYPYSRKKTGGGYMLLYLRQKKDREVGKCYYPCNGKQIGRLLSVTIPTAENRQRGG